MTNRSISFKGREQKWYYILKNSGGGAPGHNRLHFIKSAGFTLAEVLITIGVIGIVAAMTIPTLIVNHQKLQTVVKLKKIYSDLQNVVKFSEIDNGPMSGWDYPQDASYNSYEVIKPFIERYYLPYLNSARLIKRSDIDSVYSMLPEISPNITHYIILNDGVILAFYSNTPSGYIWLFADINGMKKPNKVGRDIFVFDAYKYGRLGDKYKISFWTSWYDDTPDKLALPEGYGCNKENTNNLKNFYCGRLIELNNWEIPANYPW